MKNMVTIIYQLYISIYL